MCKQVVDMHNEGERTTKGERKAEQNGLWLWPSGILVSGYFAPWSAQSSYEIGKTKHQNESKKKSAKTNIKKSASQLVSLLIKWLSLQSTQRLKKRPCARRRTLRLCSSWSGHPWANGRQAGSLSGRSHISKTPLKGPPEKMVEKKKDKKKK